MKQEKLAKKREAERDAVRQQIQVEREKRERVEKLKQDESESAAQGIKEWAQELLQREKQAKMRQDSGIFETNQPKSGRFETNETDKSDHFETNQPKSGLFESDQPKSGLVELDQQEKTESNRPNADDLDNLEELSSDEEIDVDAIRQRIRSSLLQHQAPPPRERGDCEIQFTSRNNIPTNTARESEDGLMS